METVRFSETMTSTNESTRCQNPAHHDQHHPHVLKTSDLTNSKIMTSCAITIMRR
jgi:hypothetical protein